MAKYLKAIKIGDATRGYTMAEVNVASNGKITLDHDSVIGNKALAMRATKALIEGRDSVMTSGGDDLPIYDADPNYRYWPHFAKKSSYS
jgi:hypothetical protein